MFIKLIKSIIFINLISLPVFAQFGLKVGYYIPTGDVHFAYKSGPSLEFRIRDRFDGHFRENYSISISSLKARQDTIYNLSSYYAGSPGYIVTKVGQVFSNRNSINMSGGYEFTPLEDSKFIPYVGLNINAGVVSFTYSEYEEDGSFKSSEDVAYKHIGGRVNIGVEYEVSDLVNVFAETSMMYNFEETGLITKSYEFGLGALLYF